MSYVALAAILPVALLLGLTVLRLRQSRTSPNAELLADMLDSLDRAAPRDHAPPAAAPLPSETKTA